MADERESNYKVTDRRKFNADGSPRDASHEPEPAAPEPVEQTPAKAPPTPPERSDVVGESSEVGAESNVLNFPGEGAPRKSSEAAPAAAQASAPTREEPKKQAEPTAAASAAERAYTEARGPQPRGLGEASFLELLNMLAVEAAMHLGLIRQEGLEPPPVDIEAARHMIDFIGMLQTKTRGNLTAEENQILESVLADLRLQFVALAKRK